MSKCELSLKVLQIPNFYQITHLLLGVNANYPLKVLQIANFSQITHSPTFGRAFTHENEKL